MSEDFKTEKTDLPLVKKNGGARPGSGRKQKIVDPTTLRKAFKEYFTNEDLEKLMIQAKVLAFEKPEMTKFVLEQIFGKAPQSINMDVSGKMVIENLESQINGILDERQDTQISSDALQDGGGEADGTNSETVGDIQANLSAVEAESMAISSHTVREVLDGSFSGSDESD